MELYWFVRQRLGRQKVKYGIKVRKKKPPSSTGGSQEGEYDGDLEQEDPAQDQEDLVLA